jgi:hypothetical protein
MERTSNPRNLKDAATFHFDSRSTGYCEEACGNRDGLFQNKGLGWNEKGKHLSSEFFYNRVKDAEGKRQDQV